MKEMEGTARNISLVATDDDLVTSIETIIVVSEPSYGLNDEGELEKFRTTDVLRFATSSKGLRLLAMQLNGWADEADALLKKATDAEALLNTNQPT